METPQETEPGGPLPFGYFRPGPVQSALTRVAQRMPVTWLGRRTALAVRRLVMATGPPIVDAEVLGLRLRLHPGDNVGERKFLFMPRFFDPGERSLIDAELPPDGVFVDVGANVGLYALWAVRRLGEKGMVLAIEPNPVAFERLCENLALNDAGGRAIPVRSGVAERQGTFALHLDPGNLGGSSLAGGAGGGAESIEVPCMPLLDLIQGHGASRVDILKVDVEGAEERVLVPFFDTAPAPLWPRLIIMEDSTRRWATDLIGAIESKGYRVRLRTKMNFVLERAGPEPGR